MASQGANLDISAPRCASHRLAEFPPPVPTMGFPADTDARAAATPERVAKELLRAATEHSRLAKALLPVTKAGHPASSALRGGETDTIPGIAPTGEDVFIR